MPPERRSAGFLTPRLAAGQRGRMVVFAAFVLGILLAQDVFELINRKGR